ncbi:MerR family transcriptional regulator [Streptomyces virginiae]|uniref:MerR family transcriptional regulator n=1 Tax=Streptomyces virginiae TaxID=1961 RepID=UPI003F6A456B
MLELEEHRRAAGGPYGLGDAAPAGDLRRDFPERAVDRVIRIQELYAAGLHSAKIAQILPCMRDEDGGPSVRATAALVAELATERERIDRMIGDLIRSREVLDEVIEAAAGRTNIV